MEYIGKLYGKIGKTYFPLIATTDDFERLKKIAERVLPELSLEQAEIESKRCDYAIDAAEPEGNEVNWADAAAFFLEGYEFARLGKSINNNESVGNFERLN